jgi:hypothetical protein
VKVWSLGLVSKHWNTIYIHFCYMFACSDIYSKLHLVLITIHITCILLSLRRTSAPIYLTSVLGVLGTQEIFCIVIVGLLERDSFDLLLPEFDKPWVIHLRETCCGSTNLCTWRPNTVYKDRSVHRHHWASGDEGGRQRSLDAQTSLGGTARLGVHAAWSHLSVVAHLVDFLCSRRFPW